MSQVRFGKMASTGDVVVDTMVKASFDAINVTPIVETLEHGPINILENKITEVAGTFCK